MASTTGEPIDVRYCFNKGGQGTREITTKSGRRCVGPVRARFDSSGKLVMEADRASCARGGGFYPHGVECTQGSGSEAMCYGQERGGERNRWKNSFRRSK